MPITKSAKKAFRQSVRRRELNLGRKKKMHDAMKEYKKLVALGKMDEAQKYLPQVFKTLDKMTKVGLIKRGKADRYKSRLSKKLNSKKQ
ncbi:MAG: 30S ribosomal protein S20 [Minisyncoccia bacterium]|jgi:small subunit ribosomal protein S20